MSILLEIRDYIQKFYQKYAAVLNVILRFLAAFITFFATNRVIGFNPYLDHTYTELVFAAVSVVFPVQILLFFEAVFIIFVIKKHPRNCPGFSRVLFQLLGQLKIKEQSHNPVLPSCKPLKHLS